MLELQAAVLQSEDLAKDFSDLPVGEQIQALSKQLQNVNEELHQQVRDKYDVLLQQATHAERFDLALNSLANDVERIRSNGHRLRQQVNSQYQVIENQTKVLGRLHEVSHLLRSASSLLKLSGKLKNCKHVLQQAELHYELGPLVEDKVLKNIEFVQTEYNFVLNSQQKLKSLTQMQLVSGLQERNKSQVVNALKVFSNLNTLQESLENLLLTYVSDTQQSLTECFAGNDISNTSDGKFNASANKTKQMRAPGKTPQLTTSQNYRARFWKSLHWLIYEELYENCERIKFLQEALQQLNEYAHTGLDNEHERYWKAIQELFAKNFSECPAHVKQTLQEGLAKLLHSARSFERRLQNKFLFDEKLFAALEAGYIAKCGANIKVSLANVDLPVNETVDDFITVSTIELSAALVDESLSNAVVAVFLACGKELCRKLESHIKINADTRQVVDIPNFQQIQNTSIANILYYYKQSTLRMLTDLKQQFANEGDLSAQEQIQQSLHQVDLLLETILQPIIAAIHKNAQLILLSMHREPGLNTENLASNVPSLYIKELKEFLQRAWHNHVKVFDDKALLVKFGKQLAINCVMYFIYNLSIIRPLSQAGRQRLKTDCSFLEQALQPIAPKFSELGKTARLLRAMSLLIVQQPQELVEHTPVDADGLVAPYLVLFLLFGHASLDMQSPHTAANWSNERLLEWLEAHNDQEKLELIAGALQRYRDTTRRKKIDKYAEVYPLMMSFYEKALKIFEK